MNITKINLYKLYTLLSGFFLLFIIFISYTIFLTGLEYFIFIDKEQWPYFLNSVNDLYKMHISIMFIISSLWSILSVFLLFIFHNKKIKECEE